MATDDSDRLTGVRYQPDEKPPMALTLGVGLQLFILYIFGIILLPTVVFRAAGVTEAYLTWAVFAAVVVCGVATALQAVRAGRFGGGHVLVTAPSGSFIAVSVTAVAEGGPAMFATLVAISSLVPLVLSSQLSLCRRVLTPTVLGTMIMLVPITVMSIISKRLMDVPDGTPAVAASLCALATALAIVGMMLKAKGALRSYAQALGVVFGSAVAGFSASMT